MAATAAHEPVVDLNITPLIDVLLVLIVMFILTLPIATSEVPLTLPGGHAPASEARVHRVTIAAGGALGWDGAAVNAATLDRRLRAVAAGEDSLVIAPDARARYAVVDATLAAIERAGVTRLGFQGNERFGRF